VASGQAKLADSRPLQAVPAKLVQCKLSVVDAGKAKLAGAQPLEAVPAKLILGNLAEVASSEAKLAGAQPLEAVPAKLILGKRAVADAGCAWDPSPACLLDPTSRSVQATPLKQPRSAVAEADSARDSLSPACQATRAKRPEKAPRTRHCLKEAAAYAAAYAAPRLFVPAAALSLFPHLFALRYALRSSTMFAPYAQTQVSPLGGHIDCAAPQASSS
jgi:hypothetical protein